MVTDKLLQKKESPSGFPRKAIEKDEEKNQQIYRTRDEREKSMFKPSTHWSKILRALCFDEHYRQSPSACSAHDQEDGDFAGEPSCLPSHTVTGEGKAATLLQSGNTGL